MKGQFSDVDIKLVPSQYIPKIPWLHIGKLGSIVTAICMVVWSYILTAKYENSASEIIMNPDDMFVFDTSISVTFHVYICTMLLLYQFVSNRFGKKMHIADEIGEFGLEKETTLNEDEKLSDVQVWNKAWKNHYEPSNNLKLSKAQVVLKLQKRWVI